MTSRGATVGGAEIGVVLPSEWMRVPLDVPEFEAFVSDHLARLDANGSSQPVPRDRVEQALRQLHAGCRRGDVGLAAIMTLTVGADPVVATCTLMALTQQALGTRLPLTAHTLAAALSRTADAHALVDLPCGQAARVARQTMTPAGPDGTAVPVYVEHTLVPFDGGRQAAALTCSALNTHHIAAMSELFGAIADSLRLPARDDRSTGSP